MLRRPHRRSLSFGDEGITKELLAPPGDGAIELLLVTVQPGGSSGPTSYTHAGEDAGVVLEGALWLEVDGETATLEAGDAFRFASGKPHRFGNAGAARALVLWALTPPPVLLRRRGGHRSRAPRLRSQGESKLETPSASPRILAAAGKFSEVEATCAESALATAATVYAAPAQIPPAQQAERPQPRLLPTTRGTDPVDVIST